VGPPEAAYLFTTQSSGGSGDLDQEVRNEEDRVKIYDPAHSAYSIYARATASRRDNLRRSADELRAHLAKAEKALLERGEATLGA
jgi:flagellar FliJ protein